MGVLRTILHPELYHGHHQEPPFFEGWYYKLVSADQTHTFAIIPGVFLGEDGHAFIQVLEGNTGEVSFLNYPLDHFSAEKDALLVRIGKSVFTLNHVQLDIQKEGTRIRADLRFDDVDGWPISLLSPGVMGWYAWVPKMECYHGVLGFDHRIAGFLELNGIRFDLTDGRGYIEKDWGTAFPQGYVWMQSNHFDRPNVSLTGSIAMIPWLGSAFRGFIVGLWIEGELYRFATYTGAKVDVLDINNREVVWVIRDQRLRLEIRAERRETGVLKGPTRRNMDMRVAESLQAQIHVKLLNSAGKVIFQDTGRHAGLEVAGDIETLLSA